MTGRDRPDPQYHFLYWDGLPVIINGALVEGEGLRRLRQAIQAEKKPPPLCHLDPEHPQQKDCRVRKITCTDGQIPASMPPAPVST